MVSLRDDLKNSVEFSTFSFFIHPEGIPQLSIVNCQLSTVNCQFGEADKFQIYRNRKNCQLPIVN